MARSCKVSQIKNPTKSILSCRFIHIFFLPSLSLIDLNCPSKRQGVSQHMRSIFNDEIAHIFQPAAFNKTFLSPHPVQSIPGRYKDAKIVTKRGCATTGR